MKPDDEMRGLPLEGRHSHVLNKIDLQWNCSLNATSIAQIVSDGEG